MSNEEITTTTTIIYDVRGIDQSIRSSQRLLFTVNAIRLGVNDIKRLAEDPSLSNMLWTGIQLTRIWTNLFRLVKGTNQAQRMGIARGSLMGGGIGRGAFAAGQQTLFGGAVGGAAGGGGLVAFITTLGTTLGAIAFGSPIAAAITIGVVAASATGYRQYFMDRKYRIELEEWRKKQREIAKSQGYEY